MLAKYGLAERCHEIILAGARLAREGADSLTTHERPRFVLGAAGPGTHTTTVTGGVTFDQVLDAYYRKTRGTVGNINTLRQRSPHSWPPSP